MERDDYIAKTDYLALKSPSHPLLDSLRNGYSRIKAIMLEEEIQKLPRPMPEPLPIEPRDSTMQYMLSAWRTHLNKRKHLSNEFHICRSDSERSEVSRAIEQVQKKMKRIQENIDFYEKHQDLPKQLDSDKYPVPSDDIDLIKLRNNNRSNLTKKRKRLKVEKVMRSPHLASKYNTEIQELEIHIKLLDREIAVRNTQKTMTDDN